jgi:hypothetical protein
MAEVLELTAVVAPSAPAGTGPSAPVVTAVPVSLAYVHRVEVRIPPGHAGTTGLALVDGAQAIVPFGTAGEAWLVGDDDLLAYPLGREVGTSVVLWAYNEGTFVHGWQVRITYTPMSALGLGDQVIVTPDVQTWLAEVFGGH